MTPRTTRKRKLSQSSIPVAEEPRKTRETLQIPEESRKVRERSASPGRDVSGLATIANAVKGLFSRTPDPTQTIIGGASEVLVPKPVIGDFIKGVSSQAGRIGDNVGLISSFADTALFHGGYVDDKKYQVRETLASIINIANKS
jgi:hypothetical protein